jgi:hypothetical protein
MIISQELQLFYNQTNAEQGKLLQEQMFMFQAVCSNPLPQKVLVVRCIVQCSICLSSLPRSSLVVQAVIFEEPFTSTMQTVVNVFFMEYAVMIVTEHTQVVVIRMASYFMLGK